MLKCDICSVPLTSDEMITIPGAIVASATAKGFVPSQLPIHFQLLLDSQSARDNAWRMIVVNNAYNSWGLCRSCNYDITHYGIPASSTAKPVAGRAADDQGDVDSATSPRPKYKRYPKGGRHAARACRECGVLVNGLFCPNCGTVKLMNFVGTMVSMVALLASGLLGLRFAEATGWRFIAYVAVGIGAFVVAGLVTEMIRASRITPPEDVNGEQDKTEKRPARANRQSKKRPAASPVREDASEKISFRCPSCDTKLTVNADLAGRKTDCPKCKYRSIVPSES